LPDLWFALGRTGRKFRMFLDRDRHTEDLSAEIETHAAFKTSDYVAAGLSEKAALAATRREMGNVTLAQEQSRDSWSFQMFEHCLQDVRYALRIIRKNLAFSATAILSLALGIAGSTAIFTFVNSLLIRPLPYPDSARLVRITNFFPKAVLVHFRERSRTMDIASVSPGSELNVTGMGPAFRVVASATSANFFKLLGAPVERGRAFEPGEDQPGRDDVVVLSHELWTSQFGGDFSVIGRSISLNDRDRRIIGVMPAAFALPSARVQAWIPAALDPTKMEAYWGGEFTPLVGRIRQGATIEQAAGEIHTLAANVWTLFPFPMPRHWAADSIVIPLQTDLAGDSRTRLLLLFSAVVTVLVIGCVNVAALLLARTASRRREMALRAALGAGRFRILRQLLTESVVLAAAAGLTGLGLGATALSLFRSVVPPDMPGVAQVQMDWYVAGFAAALALATGLSFGLAPAINAIRMDLLDSMKSGSQRSATRGWVQLRGWLIAGEIALTVVLLIGASLLITSLHRLMNVDPGFSTQRAIAMKISPDPSFCARRDACVAFYDRVVQGARGVPGVLDVALANTVPLDGALPAIPVDLEGHPKSADFPAPMFWTGAISPGYLRLMAIPLLAGREFSASDGADSTPVVLITASTAKRFWPGESPIGKHVKTVTEDKWRTVVGVVADVRQHDLANRNPSFLSGAFYLPYAQSVTGDGRMPAAMNLVLKTTSGARAIEDELHQLAAANNPNIPVSKVFPLERFVNDSVANFRSTTLLFLSFAGVALLLATIGIYGMVSYAVSQRTYEIGLRMAIGASTSSVVSMILGQSLRVILSGVAGGLIVAFFVTRSLSSLLYGVAAADPLVFAGASLFLIFVAVVASSIPAWRVARIDPTRTLRAE
jgi:predicted permease